MSAAGSHDIFGVVKRLSRCRKLEQCHALKFPRPESPWAPSQVVGGGLVLRSRYKVGSSQQLLLAVTREYGVENAGRYNIAKTLLEWKSLKRSSAKNGAEGASLYMVSCPLTNERWPVGQAWARREAE